ncbi:MAG: ROK family protein [Caulobacterales bacterium]|jgi:fructokinase
MRIGIDLGGTKIEAIAMSAKGEIMSRQRCATPGDYRACLAALAELKGQIEAAVGAKARRIGIAMPGSLSPATGRVRNANSQWLNGTDFLGDVGQALAAPVRVANDADCFTLSEAVDGAGAGAASVFGVIIGTGCGGGIALNGRLHRGANAIAGEWGHNPLPWPTPEEFPGPSCWCGKTGCLENWVSGPAFTRWACAMIGRDLSAPQIAALAASGDARARQAINLLADRLARGLAVVCNLLDPAVIVLGGGLSNIAGLAGAIQSRMAAHMFTDQLATRVVVNVHGDSSGVRGAAWLWSPAETSA